MKKNGFTLIELLAVIVILAIIALIAVPVILGVIEKARVGSTESSALGYIDAVEKQISINLLDKELVEIKEGTYTVEELENLGVEVKGIKPSSGTVEITSKVESATLCIGSYKVEYKENIVTATKDSSCTNNENNEEIVDGYDSKKGVNKPKLSEGMTPVKWDNNNNEIETNENDPEWYDYNSSKWANAKTEDGSYWVWIPRYAYKITSGYHSNITGTIDIKFLKGKSDKTEDETKIETSGYVAGSKDTSMHYFTHPVFQNEINELGYWVAKYEPTAAEGVANGYTSDGSCSNQNDNVSSKTVKVVPNVSSWRCITISNAYKASVAMKVNSVYGWNSSEVDTHVITNQEWGGVAYLSMSNYGTNGQDIYINNSQTYTTGCAGKTVSAPYYNGCQNAFNSTIGVKASTTHNITGVYDMSGSAWERPMAVYKNILAGSEFSVVDYTDLPSYHITKYTTLTENMQNNSGMDYDLSIYGDAVYETSGDAQRHVKGTEFTGTVNSSWYMDYSRLPYVAAPWFARGAVFTSSSNAGLGAFFTSPGITYSNNSFRPIVSIK